MNSIETVLVMTSPLQPAYEPNYTQGALVSRLKQAGFAPISRYLYLEFFVELLDHYPTDTVLNTMLQGSFEHSAWAHEFNDLLDDFLVRQIDDLLQTTQQNAPQVIFLCATILDEEGGLRLAHTLRRQGYDGPIIWCCRYFRNLGEGRRFLEHHPILDGTCDGDPEQQVVAILAFLAGSTPKPAGLNFRDRNQTIRSATEPVFCKQLIQPDYDQYFDTLWAHPTAYNALGERVMIPFRGSLGCSYGQNDHRCRFCALVGKQEPYQGFDQDTGFVAIVAMMERYRCLNLRFMDWVSPKGTHRHLLSQLADLPYDISGFLQTRTGFDNEELRLWRRLGFTIGLGVECLCDGTLALINKGVDSLSLIHALVRLAEYDIPVQWNLMFDLPGENPGRYSFLLKLLPKLVHLFPPHIVTFRPEQGCDWQTYKPPVYGDSIKNEQHQIKDLVSQWKINHDGRFGLYYVSMASFIEIHDNRSRLKKNYELVASARSLFEYCKKPRTYQAIVKHLLTREQEGAEDITEAWLTSCLHYLISRDLFIEQDGRYLNLAIQLHPEDEGIKLRLKEPIQ